MQLLTLLCLLEVSEKFEIISNSFKNKINLKSIIFTDGLKKCKKFSYYFLNLISSLWTFDEAFFTYIPCTY